MLPTANLLRRSNDASGLLAAADRPSRGIGAAQDPQRRQARLRWA